MRDVTTHRSFGLALAGLMVLAVGLTGCSGSATTVAESSAAASSSVETSQLAGHWVDVPAIWAANPLPPCPGVAVDNNLPDPPGLTLPSREAVASALAGVQSPAEEGWVQTKLGWVTQQLALTRTDNAKAVNPRIAKASIDGFWKYVKHVREELEAGHDLPSRLDAVFPEGCLKI